PWEAPVQCEKRIACGLEIAALFGREGKEEVRIVVKLAIIVLIDDRASEDHRLAMPAHPAKRLGHLVFELRHIGRFIFESERFLELPDRVMEASGTQRGDARVVGRLRELGTEAIHRIPERRALRPRKVELIDLFVALDDEIALSGADELVIPAGLELRPRSCFGAA